VTDCLLWPRDGVDVAALDRLAELAVDRGRAEKALPFFQACKALSSYRMKRFAEAIAWSEKVIAGNEALARAHACAIAAMAHWQLGKVDEARAALAKGEGLAPAVTFQRGAETLGGDWVAWLIARISLDEAKALMGSAAN
jgi:hypothetical protein